MAEIIDISSGNYTDIISIYENSILYFRKKIDNFDIGKLSVKYSENHGIDVKYSYSFDNTNWSNPVVKELWDLDMQIFQNTNITYIYLSIWFFKQEENKTKAYSLTENKNIHETKTQCAKIFEIKYDDIVIDLLEEKNLKLISYSSITNKLGRWNFYDNQNVNIRRWLDICISTTNGYGHKAIYFKTEPVETSHTFSNHVLRNVVSVKKMLVMCPGNELPQDRTIYTDWDMPLEGEFVIHVVNEIFTNCFGENKLPLSKDYLYFPIIDKLFRVSSVQPKNGFMGKIGWWEVFLSKFEDDETIGIDESMKEIYAGFPGYSNDLEELNIIDELGDFLDDKVLDKEILQEKNIDEKKNYNDNFTNKLVDSTVYIDLKETDAQREFYSKRLQITSINPDNNAFPVTMYDCTTVAKRVVALTYDLNDLTSVNKKSLLVDELEFSFNFVLLGKFSGELFDFNNQSNFSNVTLEINRQNISIILHNFQKTIKFDYKFELNEFYQISLKYNETLKQVSIIIVMLKDSEKTIVFQNVYIITSDIIDISVIPKMEIKKLFLYGGSFFVNELLMKINKNKILSDNVNPILIMNQFGL